MAASNDWTGKVADDMHGIFASAGLAGDRIDNARPSRDVSCLPARQARTPRRMRWLTLGAPILALATAGFLFTQIDTASPVDAAPARPAVTRKVEHVAFTAVAPEAAAPSAEAVLRTDVAPLPATPGIAKAAAVPDDRPERAVRRVAMAARAAPRADGCHADSTENACIYRDVRAADRRLYVAYQRAVEAGVPRRDLVEVRRDWTRALAISLDEPDETIRRYDDLADQLRYLTNVGSTPRFASNG